MTIRQPVEEWLGAVVESSGDGHATLRMTVTHRHINGSRALHGGVIFALADAALAHAAIIPHVGATTWAHITFIAPGHLGDELVSTARVAQRWGSNSVVDVTIRASDRVIAEFRGQARVPLPTTRAQPVQRRTRDANVDNVIQYDT